MPTYDYRCDSCGHELEIFQSMTSSPKRKCPECGTLKLKRVIGAGAGIIFKGSGFYETDYRSDSYKKGEEKEKKSREESKSDTKGKDSKSDNKSKGKKKSTKDGGSSSPAA
jgi:putative FmdB family regulatory protein